MVGTIGNKGKSKDDPTDYNEATSVAFFNCS